LYVSGDLSQSVVSELTVPLSLQDNSTRSVEAWVYTATATSGSTPVGWGSASIGQLSSFRNANATNGLFAGWGNDAGWSGNVEGQWDYYVWTWDESTNTISGYRNGVFIKSQVLSALDTSATVISIGSARNGTADVINGYLADVRVQTGLLSASDVANNYSEGIYVIPEPASMSLILGVGVILFGVLRRNKVMRGKQRA